jgi:fatty acid desaturase
MNLIDCEFYITQAEYAKKLRPLLPKEAFLPSFNKVWILLINLSILALGWGVADHLEQWHWYFLWIYLPLAVVMGNSVVVLLFSTHDLLHSQTIKNPLLRRILSLISLTMLWTPPTFWKIVHNREHHHKTNSLQDPDRNYLSEQPKTWGKWIQNLFVPSAEVYPVFLIIGMAHAWGVHTFRNLTSVLFFSKENIAEYVPASFTVSSKERKAIVFELSIILSIHVGILSYLDFNPLKIVLGYFLPIWIGYSGVMFYIYTNHMLCRMTSVNDPLLNSLSIKVPKIFDILHLNFSYHTEHHIFPGINSDYYPIVQTLLETHYPGRANLLNAWTAWGLMLGTPRHYKDENTFTDWAATKSVVCPLSIQKG